MQVMVPMCVQQLIALGSGESEAQLEQVVEEFVWRLTGKETIYQMMALCEAIRARGGEPLPPLTYKKMYLDRLWMRIRDRLEALRERRASPETYLVPGARQLLETLTARGLMLYLASGTDDANVKEEAALLDIARYFDGRIFGAHDDMKRFSKAMLVQQIVSQAGFERDELVVFGDGFVEIEEVKKVGGVAIGVATHEPECLTIDDWKKQRLIAAGADVIIPNYRSVDEIKARLFDIPALVQR
jgi:phosphoglycolate phosphatase-like HAD superfamily hydrolase